MYFSKATIPIFSMLFLCSAWANPESLLEQLRNDHAILVRAERDFQHQRSRGLLGATASADYSAWIAQLRERVRQDCVNLASSDRPLPVDFPCPSVPVAVTGAAPIDLESEKTVIERAMALDAELSADLAEFDEMLLREQERVKASRPSTGEHGGDGAGGADGNGDDGDGGDGQLAGTTAAAGGTGSEATEGGELSGAADSTSPDGARGGPGRVGRRGPSDQPPDIPDGSDDDVVARQLREAAEKETDPELKKKLWEEYRKYKKGTR